MRERTRYEKIIEVDDTIKHLEKLMENLVTRGGVTGMTGTMLGSTLVYLDITLKVTHSFMPSILNKEYSFKVAQNIARPIVQTELDKLYKERRRLTSNWFIRTFTKSFN